MGLLDRFKKKHDDTTPPELAALLVQLKDKDWKVRLEACRALGKLGRRAVTAGPALQELIDDDNGDVCNAAAAALSDIERH